jgi:hypothetical protein
MPTPNPDRAVTNAELLQQLREVISEVNWRLANYLEAAAHSPEAVDEGFLLATKASRIIRAPYHGEHVWHHTLRARHDELEGLTAAETVESDA